MFITSFQRSFPYTASIRLSPSQPLDWVSFNASCLDNQKYNCLPKYVSSDEARVRKWEVILFSVESDATIHNGSRNDTITGFVVYVGYTGREGTQERENALFGLGHLMRNVWYLDLIEETVSLTASFYEPIELLIPESEASNRFSRSIVNDSNSIFSSTPKYGSSEPNANGLVSRNPSNSLYEPNVDVTDSSTPRYGSSEPNGNGPDSSTPRYGSSEPNGNGPDSSTPRYGSSEPNGNGPDSSTPTNGSSDPNLNYPDFTTPWYFGGYQYDVIMTTNPPSTVQKSAIRVVPAWAYKSNLETIQKELDFRQLDVVYRHEGVSIANTEIGMIVTISDPGYVNHFTELHFCNRIILRADEFYLLYKNRILYYIHKDRYLFIGEFSLIHDPFRFNKTIGAYVCIENTSFEPVRGVNAGFRALVSIQAVVLMLCIHTSI